MLSRLLFVRLKAAENALRDGRLDEAYRLATAPDIREHRRGAAILTTLADRFIERARNHYRADRFTEALMDLERAETGGVKGEEIAELRGHVRTVASEQRRREQTDRERIENARRRVEDGSLAAGRRILENAGENDPSAEALRRQVEHRAEDAAEIVEQAERLMAQGQTTAAASRLKRAKSIDAHNEALARLETRLCEQVLSAARAALAEGRLNRAADELDCLGGLGKTLPARRELVDLLGIARQTARCVRVTQYAEARRHAMSLGRLLPRAEWIKELISQLGQIEELKTALCAGPLGDRMNNQTPKPLPGAPHAASLDDTVALPGRGQTDGSLPDRLLLLVDGGGSYLILRGERVSLGRATSRKPADIPVYSDIAENHANIQRVDDDYFLFTDKDVEVAGRRTPHQLLRDGDRVVMGRKAKLSFRLPSRKSPTAVLDLSDTTKMPNDVRRVVLFHRHAAVGSGPGVHIGCRHAGPSLVLFERNGAMWLRQKSDGHVDTDAVELRLGEPVEIAGASLVLQPWVMHAHGRTI